MKLRVLGCHGGSSREHRSPAFLIDDRLALDAGSLARSLTLPEQAAVQAVLVTHTHFDHIADLPTFADARLQTGAGPVEVGALPEVVDALRSHCFDGTLWPDFTRLPEHAPAVRLRTLAPGEAAEVAGFTITPVPVDHGVPSCGFLVDDGARCLAFSGDTGPTTRFWELAADAPRLAAVLTEVSFPDAQEPLARASGHLTPSLLAAELERFGRADDVPVYVYGLKPAFAAELRGEIAERLPGVTVLAEEQVLELG